MKKLTQFLIRALELSWLKGSRLAWLLAPLLWPMSKLVWFALRVNALWRGPHHIEALPVALLVVGNVYVGGVGKTPLVMAIIDHFKNQGLKLGVISKAYATQGPNPSHTPRLLSPQDQASEVGDEPLLIFQRTGVPVCIGLNRHLAAKHLLQLHPEVQLIISDDGLQNNSLAPEMTVCVFDNRGLGNGWTLPAGPLREVWPRIAGLHPSQSAPYQWVMNTGDQPQISGFACQRSLAKEAHNAKGLRVKLDQLQTHPTEKLIALAGVGQPDLFFKMLKDLGLELDQCVALSDHAKLQAYQDVLEKLQITRHPNTKIVCTEKDAVKLWTICPQAYAVALRISLPSEFLDELDQALSRVMQKKRAFSNATNTDMINR